MKNVTAISEMQLWAKKQRQQGNTIGFVPTMGFLHEGHLELVRKSKACCNLTVVSVFVNPLQFGPQEDFDRYPRDLKRDQILLRQENVDILFYPDHRQMYPEGSQTFVEVTDLTKPLCGEFRPGHFRGVATVVLKLFNIVQPDTVFFGLKDYQQCVVIQQMAKDLHLSQKIVAVPTVREKDGLAMSSRNQYLSSQEREKALTLFRALNCARELVAGGETQASVIISRVQRFIEQSFPTHIDYIALSHPETLLPILEIEDQALLALAVWYGKTRLIDNVMLSLKNFQRK